ncbi:MAG: ABC transporter ATP-binding protein, partial [Lachnospiraceae bacterium]|nr:ABC transporter ATP-binding protein [Lachnospiraceae bacterium]
THVVSDIEFIEKLIIMLKSGQIASCDTCQNLIKSIENKVFELEISRDKLNYFQNNYRISNIYNSGENIIVRIVTDNLPKNYKCTSVKPTLEDLYLYMFE